MELLIAIFVVGILYTIFEANIKGFIGEKIVAAILSGLPKQQYRVVNNVMLGTEYGTTQIDHVVVSVYGIFVIETKNYKGWITGSEFGDYWTKNMYGKKYKFQNPLKQNYAHVKALEDKLVVAEDKLIPIVAFSNNSDIKVKTSKPVVYISQLKKVIKVFDEIKFEEDELDIYVEKLKKANITTAEARRDHVKQIQKKIETNEVKASAGICPKCGKKLVTRKGKRGVFVGCSGYPKCRYTR